MNELKNLRKNHERVLKNITSSTGVKNSTGKIEVKRHCIVTPDIIGPINNGGIGTACFHLAKYLKKEGDEVDILFTGPCEIASNSHWKSFYQDNYGIGYYAIFDYPSLPFQPINEGRWFMQRSMVVHKWLQERNYNQIHFQEWQANGFCALQARRVTGAYENTLITICLHSSSEWQRQGMRQFSRNDADSIILDYCERYAVENADIAIFPSKHMLNWCEENKWNLPAEKIVVPYHIDTDAVDTKSVEKIEKLIFFGRLETRKGLELFVQSLLNIEKEISLPVIEFYGKIGSTSEGMADEYLKKYLEKNNIRYTIFSDKSSQQCISILKNSSNCVVVVPSLMDNLPYTVYECLAHGIPLIAARTGGIPEMVHSEDNLFDANIKSITNKLNIIINQGLNALPKTLLPEEAVARWKKIRNLPPKRNLTSERPGRLISPSDITICIAHFNYGIYLPELLESLNNQTVKGFKVIIVDDGSTNLDSIAVFEMLSEKYSYNKNWIFCKKNNGGIGNTRNYVAKNASTDYLIFMDADNIAELNMVERFTNAMSIFDGDVLTCYLRAFQNSKEEDRKIVYSYMPPGPCLEAGYRNNVFGDANFLIKRKTFERIGGFGECRQSSFEDWELLARIALEGYKMDVIPEHLFLYRHTEEGFSRNTSPFLNYNRVLSAYKKTCSSLTHRLAEMNFSITWQ